MFKFGIENLRRLKMVAPVDLKPLTLLVRRNSAGKSTFLRSFALLRQSITTRTSAPLLWFGVVDFGTFKGAVHNNDSKLDIQFSFELDTIGTDPVPYYSPSAQTYFFSTGQSHKLKYDGIKLRVGIGSHEDSCRLTTIELSIASIDVLYELRVRADGFVDKLSVNKQDALPYFKSSKIYVSPGSLLPELNLIRTEHTAISAADMQMSVDMRTAVGIVSGMVRPYIDKRLTTDTVNELSARLLTLPTMSKEAILSASSDISVKSWKKLLVEIAE